MGILNKRFTLAGIVILLVANFLLSSALFAAKLQHTYKILSPDRQTVFELVNDKGNLSYYVNHHHSPIVKTSRLGFVFNNVTVGKNTVVSGKTFSSHRGSFAWRLGEDDSISNNYNEVVFACASGKIRFNIVVRVYDGSVAFRYKILSQSRIDDGNIMRELTTFVFDKPLTIFQFNQESVFIPISVDSMKNTCDFPATLTDHKNTYISIGEADNENYTKAELIKGAEENSLQISFMHDSVVHITSGYETPWRTISYSNTAIGLHKFSQLYLKLVNPVYRRIPSWIVPGKLIRSQLTTADGLRCVDFAVAHNFQYVLFDGGWYGPQRLSTSHPERPIAEINLHKIIEYGKEKGIGVILYIDRVELKAKLDTLLPLYKSWGVKGLKFGFVDGLTQNGLRWLNGAMKKVMDEGFILDIHDNYKPTGLSRKYPCLLTQEGIRGDEHGPDAFHTTTLPFTRFLAGPADFTFCYPNAKNSFSKNLKVSMAQQLALTVIYFSPLQSMFWYGRPENYTNEQQIEFFKYVPTVWDESHYLAGEIGKYISVARRKGKVWFIGNAAGLQDWNGSIKLNFLSPHTIYKAIIYTDGIDGGIVKKAIELKEGDALPIHIKAKGGEAVIITPLLK